MRTPVPFYVVTATPNRQTDLGTITEGHYVYANGIVTLTNASWRAAAGRLEL